MLDVSGQCMSVIHLQAKKLMDISICAYKVGFRKFSHIYIRTYIYIVYIVHSYVRVYIHMNLCMHACMPTYVYMYIHM